MLASRCSCRSDCVLPLEFPVNGVDGNLIHELVVPKGVELVVYIFGVNRDPAIWGLDAAEWKPERWLTSSTEVKVQVPGVYANMYACRFSRESTV